MIDQNVDIWWWHLDIKTQNYRYALSSAEVIFDTAWPWKVKDRFGLVRSAISGQAQFLLLCPALSYSALLWGHHEKVGAQ